MGVISRTLTPTVADGRPLKTAKNVVMFGDNLRATFVDGIPLLVGVAFLYDKAMIQGDSSKTWSFGDVILVWITAWFIKRFGVIRRWT